MTFSTFVKELNGNRVEGEIIRTVFYSLLVSFGFLAILYFFKFKEIEGFISKQGIFLFFSALSYAIITPAARQIKAYREMPCMSGMMVGMTSGMISGFLPGFYVASTNGMFVGSVFGMAIGIVFGMWNGKCCGIMGMMEGAMAGFMGGLMGAMTAFMLLNDNLIPTSFIVFIVSAFIMFGLNYLVYKEMKESERQIREDYFTVLGVTFVLITITTYIIVYGPRSLLFQ